MDGGGKTLGSGAAGKTALTALFAQAIMNGGSRNRRLPHRNRDLIQSGHDIAGAFGAQHLRHSRIDQRAERRVDDVETLSTAAPPPTMTQSSNSERGFNALS